MSAISDAIQASAVARVVGVETRYQDLSGGVVLLPQRLALIGSGSTLATYLTDKRIVFSALEVGQIYGFGSPLHLAAEQLLPATGDGLGTIPLTVYPLVDGTTAAAGTITVAGIEQNSDKVYFIKINEKVSEAILIPATTTPAAAVALLLAGINANVAMPALASDSAPAVDITAKAKGIYGNDLFIEVIGEEDGLTFTVVQPTGGAGNPDVQPALDKFGSVWETLVMNCLTIDDTTNLDKYQTFGEGRWLPIKPKPFVVFTGNTEASPTLAVTTSDARKDDRINVQLVAPGSKELPLVVAARQLARIAQVANDNPPTDYAGQKADGLEPGADNLQWEFSERDFAVKAGSSTIEVVDNVIEMSDTITFYHPTGDTTPAYRYVVDIQKVMNVTFNIRKIFEADDWKGKILIPDGQTGVTNSNARRPSTAVAAVAGMIDGLFAEGIIADPVAAKKSILAGINAANPKRLDLSFNYQITGNTNQIAITQKWGFYFGSALAA